MCLALGRLHCLAGVLGPSYDFHSAATAPEGGLDRDWPAARLAEGDDLGGGGHRLAETGHAGNTGPGRREAGVDLVAHRLDGTGRRTDEAPAGFSDRAGKRGVLGEKPVTGVDGIGFAAGEDFQDRLDCKVAFGRALAPEGVGLVG